ncbi:MAG: SDR family oxidoreductase [Chitinophagaceae bacterium]|nr:SDR family oxidoreductase [Chitinophagaceae bacterium]
MKVLVTGANGFLGHYLIQQLLQKKYEVIATGKGDPCLSYTGHENFQYVSMDFTDPFAVHDVFEKYAPEMVVHAGALSRVDECEQNQWEAYRANVEGTVTMLINAEAQRSFFIFISTDFIFDGKKGMYKEEDEPGPVNFYGKTKLEAEEAVKEYEHSWAILRTILVYGKPHSSKDNILTNVKRKLEKGEEYKVVNDQVRTPTYVEDLAAAIVSAIERKATGIYHIGGADILTPYQMACAVSDHFGFDRSLLKEVAEDSFSQPAKRPLKTGFIIDKAKMELGYSPLSFAEALQKTFADQK